jgi:3-polyprenyl-4-hydroxybenzoate decarboxylase
MAVPQGPILSLSFRFISKTIFDLIDKVIESVLDDMGIKHQLLK